MGMKIAEKIRPIRIRFMMIVVFGWTHRASLMDAGNGVYIAYNYEFVRQNLLGVGINSNLRLNGVGAGA